ncbi:MAG: type II toxin-antitoxin system Phd/YefM family antitoxin [Muribaculaceae bacterium]|nr:type II toxin-antitoxin system Phd/YefM family antitoxin [Muribaculaceae bacterium]
MKTTNYTDLRNNLKSYLDAVASDNEPLIVSRPGAESVVVISLEDYNAIMETEFVLQRPRLMQSLLAAEEDIAYGRVTAQQEGESIDELLDRVTCSE